MVADGVPQPVIPGFGQASASGGFDLGPLTGVGDMGAANLAAVSRAVPGAHAPVIPKMVEGIHAAFSLATAQTFWLGVVGATSRPSRPSRSRRSRSAPTNDAPVPTVAIDEAAAAGAPSGKPAASTD